jgi:tetratricopeptide (TPR) repeat protein
MGQQQYYEMPLISALRKSVPMPSSSGEKQEYIKSIYQGLSTGITVTHVDRDLLLGVSVGITHGAIVALIDSASKPWDAIPVTASEQEAFRYAAQLDYGLSAAAEGDYSTALALFEEAGLHAPTALEKARSLALMAKLTAAVIGGSIGALQSLSLYNEAYRTWRDAESVAKAGEQGETVEGWLKEELAKGFESYGSAYPEVARVLALDPKAVRAAEVIRRENDRGRPIADLSEFAAALDSVKRRLSRAMAADNAENWFDAERERLARLDSKSLIVEARQAVSRGPDEARWFAEMLMDLYAGGMGDEKNRVSAALATAAVGCREPWRSQFGEFLSMSAGFLDTGNVGSSGSSKQLGISLKSARRFGLSNSARMIQELLSQVRSQSVGPTTARFDELPPSAAWWTKEYLDWFLATAWSVITHSAAACDHPSQLCEEELMERRPYICADGSEGHHLFAPGLGLAMWMLGGQPRVDPWWDHSFYFGLGTHFLLIAR